MKTFRLLPALSAVIAISIAAISRTVVNAARSLGERMHAAIVNHMAGSGLMLGMATLAADKPRTWPLGDIVDLPMIAADIIYEGAAVGDNGSGLARPLVAADPFLGFAQSKADNSAGAASALNVRVKARGYIEIPVTGASSADDVGATVYASDDDTFTLTSSGNTAIGKVARWVTGTTCVVYFESVTHRSI